jgi:hypothetical protein
MHLLLNIFTKSIHPNTSKSLRQLAEDLGDFS